MAIFRLFKKIQNQGPQKPRLTITVDGLTHQGRVRKTNQDELMFNDMPSEGSHVVAVADGMGGHNGGEIASSQAIRIFIETLKDGYDGSWRWPLVWGENPTTSERNLVSFILERALMTAHFALCKLGKKDPALAQMGTTFTGGVIEENTLHYIHAGDTRLYLLRDGELYQLTHDDRFDPLVHGHLLNPAALEEISAMQNTLVQCVGSGSLRPHWGTEPLKPGDSLLFCSDGLTNQISDEHIRRILDQKERKLCEKVRDLIDAAFRHDGSDNITALVVQCS